MVEGLESRIQKIVEDVAETPMVSAIIEAWNDRENMPKHKDQKGENEKESQVGTAKHENPNPGSLPNLELVLQRIEDGGNQTPAPETKDKSSPGSYGEMGNPLQIDTIPAVVDFKAMRPT